MLLTASLFVPSAAAAHASVGLGIDAKGLKEAAAAGADPSFSSFWAGKWMTTYGWGGLESALASSRAHDTTLVVLWYYWGNDISPACFAAGCNGKSVSEWSNMTGQLADVVAAKGGGRKVFVVLEPEFNKQQVTISSFAPTLDAHLAAQADRLHETPNLKVVAGYGLWDLDLWSRFPQTLDAADAVGFQAMRGSTQHNESVYRGVAQQILSAAKKAHWLEPSKPVLVYDLALASHGGAFWERVQKETLSSILARRDEYAAAGVVGILYRAMRDDPNMDQGDYFGPAEVTWGLKRADGTPKPAWYPWVNATSHFTGVKGNAWWVEARVAGSPARVEARVHGEATCALPETSECGASAWAPLTKRSWGAWAVSTRAPAGSVVELRATYANGGVEKQSYAWTDATPVERLDAQFLDIVAKDWWTQVEVRSGTPLKAVHVRVDDGAWVALQKQTWGDWARSVETASGSTLRFRATSTTGAVAVSDAYVR